MSLGEVSVVCEPGRSGCEMERCGVGVRRRGVESTLWRGGVLPVCCT